MKVCKFATNDNSSALEKLAHKLVTICLRNHLTLPLSSKNHRQEAIVRFVSNFVTLALVAGFDIGLDLWAKASPGKSLGDGVDGLSNSWVAKVGMVPINDVSA